MRTKNHPDGTGFWPRSRNFRKAFLAALLSTATAVSIAVLGTVPARADTAPVNPNDPATPVTVAADGLPTAQINGVAWAQVIIGNTVYVGGNFTEARASGAAPGTGVARSNLLAYNLTTGVLINTFAPTTNGEVTALAASPDGSRLYVGGSFTNVNGSTVWRLVALNPSTGAIITSFLPKPSASVRAIVATADTVYFGGLFDAVGSVSRGRLAAVTAANATLLPWNPIAAGGRVNALALAPDGASMVVGGAFTTLNGSSNPGFGLGRVDTNTGLNQAFPINNVVRNGGTTGSITTLATDGTNVYGAGYTFGRASTLEGMFSVNWSDNTTKWIEDCHGDTYSITPMGDVLYLAGHAHYCGNAGGFPQKQPWEFNRGLAFSKAATGVLTQESHGYTNFAGTPRPELLNWFPILDAGSFTGQDQGPWTMASNADYVAMAGEFTIVNNQPQQGLTRYAKSSIAPNLRGPRVDGTNLNPTLSTPAAGQVRVRWQANWDQDNQNLTYQVLRDSNVISTVQQTSTFWDRPGMTFLDTGLVPGQEYRYRVYTRDPFGNEARSDSVTITASGDSPPSSGYAASVLADSPSNFWRLGEATGSTGVDLAGKDDLKLMPGVTFGAAGAVIGETDTAGAFNGTTSGVAFNPTLAKRPNVFSTEAWFRTNTGSGGEIIGYGNSESGVSADYDRVVYMSNVGRLYFGVQPNGGARQTISTLGSYNNNQWHHVVATLGSNGMQLFVDGVLQASRTDVTTAWPIDAYWRIGGDNLGNWTQRPSSRYLNGQIDEVAIYPTVLPLSRVQAHYVASGRTVIAPPAPPVARFTYTTDGLTVNVDGTTSSDANGPISSYAWNFGDGGTGTGVTAQHTYAAGGTYNVQLTVTDNTGFTNSVTHAVTVTAPPPNQPPVAAFTSTVTNLAVAFNGSGSNDPDGTIASYAWTFGDGGTAGTVSPNHSYAAAGTYPVTLTVTDDDGDTGTLTQDVTVTEPPADTILAADDFGRTATGAWGSADTGGAWTIAGGNSNFAVNNGSGAMTVGTAGQSRSALLNSVTTADVDARVEVSADKVANGGGYFASLLGRHVGSNDYRAKVKVASTGAVSLYLTRVVGGVETTIAGPVNIAGLTAGANDPLVLRLKLEGINNTAVSGKVWRASATEPAAWQLTASDNTDALEVPGGVGLVSYVSGSTTNVPLVLRYDRLNATAGGNPTPNVAPVAAFTSSVTNLSASFNAGGSSDNDGSITGYAWTFGDSSTGTGQTPSHTYAAAGTYQVTLTVTDDDGATNAVTHPVTVNDPPPAAPLAADAFGRTVSGGWGSADSGGAWTIGSGATNYNVAGGVGTMLLGTAGASRSASLNGVSAPDTDVQVKASLDKIGDGGGTFVSITGRRVGTEDYRAKLKIAANGATTLYLTRTSGGTETTLVSANVAGLTLAAGDAVQIRFQVTGTGPTTLRARVWRDGAAEPASWNLTTTDSTATLQAAGSTALIAYLSGSATNTPVTVRFDDYLVRVP
ncbi:PKD domain-containing protein [Arthrobacter cupressi]|uniref:PKD repeat-containing protein n=1 Tax=Arthrobacter cupressi TaxID=1045773 RepID=A0A1G8IZ73_9MICC|nr:PKD domain-containing protein [Arthrobacter cupressi]NYD79162.1 PKD repeat protein [Arthrobacter cupressi]SDI23730.1 PKD repeat-containing protein [Arthrobacter cupressi]